MKKKRGRPKCFDEQQVLECYFFGNTAMKQRRLVI